MKFNAGDKVRIKSIQWYNENKNDKGDVVTAQGSTFYKRMSRFCGESRVIKAVYGTFYKLENDSFSDNWNDDMIEGKFKVPKTQEEINNYLSKISIKDAKNLLSIEKRLEDDKLVLPDNILINKSSGISSSEFIEWYKYFEYPKTYEECCKVLGCKADYFFTDFSYDNSDVEISDYEDKIDDLLQNFRKLRYCRDAYWKIAGEQMGLGKPWEPNWENENKYKYGLFRLKNIIYKDATCINPVLLIFPTFEMRDAFYENFKELIEICKELL